MLEDFSFQQALVQTPRSIQIRLRRARRRRRRRCRGWRRLECWNLYLGRSRNDRRRDRFRFAWRLWRLNCRFWRGRGHRLGLDRNWFFLLGWRRWGWLRLGLWSRLWRWLGGRFRDFLWRRQFDLQNFWCFEFFPSDIGDQDHRQHVQPCGQHECPGKQGITKTGGRRMGWQGKGVLVNCVALGRSSKAPIIQ